MKTWQTNLRKTLEERLEEIMAWRCSCSSGREGPRATRLPHGVSSLKGLFPTEEMAEDEVDESSPSTFVVSTPIGQFKVDMEEFEAAKTRAKDKVNPPKYSKARQMTREFIGGEDKMDFRYWSNNLGSLIKLHMDTYFSKEDLVKEFDLEGKLETQATYANLQLGDEGTVRFMQHGYRFYERDGERFVVISSKGPRRRPASSNSSLPKKVVALS